MEPGPPPLCSWGASQELPGGGVPAPNYKGQLGPIRATSGCRPFEFASKFMSILMSMFGRFGVDLEPLLGLIFDHVGAFFGPSWSRNRLRTVLSSKKCFLSTKPFEINGFRRFFAQDGAPKRPKAPRRVQDRLG